MKRILALFLGILFLFSALPISVFAEGTKDFADTVNEEEYIDITKLTKISYEDALSDV